MILHRLFAFCRLRRRSLCLLIGVNIIILLYVTMSLRSTHKDTTLISLRDYISLKGLSANLVNKLKHTIRTGLNVTTVQGDASRPQKCKIPKLDPYHPDVKPFIHTVTAPTCDYPKLTYVTDDGFLKVRDESKVKEAKYAYMVRVDENRNTFTKWKIFYDKTNNSGKEGIIFFTNFNLPN